MKPTHLAMAALALAAGAGVYMHDRWPFGDRQAQRMAATRHLTDPASAQFRLERASSKDSRLWCGEINARNRQGGMVGFRRYVVDLQAQPPAAYFSRPEDADFDAQERVFHGFWYTFCEATEK